MYLRVVNINGDMKNRFFTLLVAVAFATQAWAQTAEDSVAIVNAQWETTLGEGGIVHKRALIPMLYRGSQHINYVEIPRSRRFVFGLGSPGGMERTSDIAQEHQALAAINGSYYNMKVGNSVCFYKVGKEVVDTTAASEFEQRVTGAVYVHKRKVRLMPWDAEMERAYRGRKGTVLASGPLLMKDGDICSWDDCGKKFITTKHPRSALYVTPKSVVFITVDGRSPGNAVGVNIPELTHLIKVLGGTDAINLDGGGSTTLWMADEEEGRVLNCPSDNKQFDHEGERSVSNAFFVRKR